MNKTLSDEYLEWRTLYFTPFLYTNFEPLEDSHTIAKKLRKLFRMKSFKFSIMIDL